MSNPARLLAQGRVSDSKFYLLGRDSVRHGFQPVPNPFNSPGPTCGALSEIASGGDAIVQNPCPCWIPYSSHVGVLQGSALGTGSLRVFLQLATSCCVSRLAPLSYGIEACISAELVADRVLKQSQEDGSRLPGDCHGLT